jgi:hypothetical protein
LEELRLIEIRTFDRRVHALARFQSKDSPADFVWHAVETPCRLQTATIAAAPVIGEAVTAGRQAAAPIDAYIPGIGFNRVIPILEAAVRRIAAGPPIQGTTPVIRTAKAEDGAPFHRARIATLVTRSAFFTQSSAGPAVAPTLVKDARVMAVAVAARERGGSRVEIIYVAELSIFIAQGKRHADVVEADRIVAARSAILGAAAIVLVLPAAISLILAGGWRAAATEIRRTAPAAGQGNCACPAVELTAT